MKSSTLHKSNLSKERIKALEELISEKSMPYDSSPGVYIRNDKDRELDKLWQDFKFNQRDDRSQGLYLIMGFLAGALSMFLVLSLFNLGNSSENFAELKLWKKANSETAQVNNPISITPASEEDITRTITQNYRIRSGDSLETIALKFYGSSAPMYVKKIQKANNLRNSNFIVAGRKLTIPIDN